jgi:hypothetical protein
VELLQIGGGARAVDAVLGDLARQPGDLDGLAGVARGDQPLVRRLVAELGVRLRLDLLGRFVGGVVLEDLLGGGQRRDPLLLGEGGLALGDQPGRGVLGRRRRRSRGGLGGRGIGGRGRDRRRSGGRRRLGRLRRVGGSRGEPASAPPARRRRSAAAG